jgi:hypothetical protein
MNCWKTNRYLDLKVSTLRAEAVADRFSAEVDHFWEAGHLSAAAGDHFSVAPPVFPGELHFQVFVPKPSKPKLSNKMLITEIIS